MLVGLVRPSETRSFELTGTSLADVKAQALAQTPPGWELASVPVRMEKGTTALTATATIVRRGDAREIEAETMEALRATIPEDWQLVSVRRVGAD